jgi:hypothetical protein
LGIWLGSNVVIINLNQNECGMIIKHGKFVKAEKEHLLVDLYSLNHSIGISSKYTHVIGLNNDNDGHCSFPSFTMLACGKGPFIDLLYYDDDEIGGSSKSGSSKISLLHSWDIRKFRDDLPLKIKIYAMNIHSTIKSLIRVSLEGISMKRKRRKG